jgi:hypothetical protein
VGSGVHRLTEPHQALSLRIKAESSLLNIVSNKNRIMDNIQKEGGILQSLL